MRRLLAVIGGIALVLALAASAAASTRVVAVPGEAGWVATGIEVEGGEVLEVKTLGFTTTAMIPAFFIPGEFISGSGPAGQTTGSLCGDVEDVASWGPCALDSGYFGELAGRVGDGGFDVGTFHVGDTTAIVIPAGLSGELYLAVNDFELTYGDNNGQYTILFR